MDIPGLDALSIRDYRTLLPLARFTPKDIEGWLHTKGGIIGQNAACRSIASLLYNHFHYPLRPKRNLLLVGQTGCGKTHLINAMTEFVKQNAMPNTSKTLINNFVKYYDSTQCNASTWKGGIKIYNMLYDIGFMGCVLVLDEWDKTVRTTYGSVGSGSVCVSNIIQQNFLTLFDHLPSLTFADDSSGNKITVDGQKISIICLGAFSDLRERKQREHDKRLIGFSGKQCVEEKTERITEQDLISYGMLSEIASRMSDPVIMDPLTLDDLVAIGRKEIDLLQKTTELRIHINNDKLLALAQIAFDSGLGGRYLKNQLNMLLDEQIYESPACEQFYI